jgi:PmbA protein
MSDADLERASAEVLDRARPGEQAEVFGLHRRTLTVEAGTGGELLSVGRAEVRGLGVRVLTAGRTGYASTSDLRPSAVAACLDAARAAAALARPDDDARLPEPEPIPELDGLDHPGLASLPLTAKLDLATGLARRATEHDPRVRTVHSAVYREERARVSIASTTGVAGSYVRGFADLAVDVVGEDGDTTAAESARRTVRDPADLDVEAIAAEAVARTVRLLGPRVPVPLDVPVLLDPDVTAALLTAAGWAMTGAPAGRGPLAAGSGDPVAADCLTLLDDGLDPRFPASAPFDDQGVPRQRTPLLAKGELRGMPPWGNARRGSHKVPPAPGPSTLLLVPTPPVDVGPVAVHVQQLSVGRSAVHPVTGRIGVGITGFVLRDGEPAGAFRSSWRTTLHDVLGSVVAVGDDLHLDPDSPTAAATLVLNRTALRPCAE